MKVNHESFLTFSLSSLSDIGFKSLAEACFI